jgi:hypothetical protein
MTYKKSSTKQIVRSFEHDLTRIPAKLLVAAVDIDRVPKAKAMIAAWVGGAQN